MRLVGRSLGWEGARAPEDLGPGSDWPGGGLFPPLYRLANGGSERGRETCPRPGGLVSGPQGSLCCGHIVGSHVTVVVHLTQTV